MLVKRNYKMALLSPKDVADRYGFHVSHIRRLAREGLIESKKVGRCYVIEEKSLKRFKRKYRNHRIKDKHHHEDMGN